MSNRLNKSALLTGTFMAGAMIAAPAYAQDAESIAAEEAASEGEAIIVTGSRIARRNVETAAPIAVVDAEEFSLSGTVNVENVINALPQVLPGNTSASNNPGNGTATLNLRGLGANRTLVLVNGRRWVSFDTAQIVDLNTIPSFLLDSVDVVTGGASAVYGSDAISGVVNFRLREVEGLELGGQYALTDRGDGESYQLNGAIGTSFDDGRGSATVFAEYFNRSAVFQGDRAFSNNAIGGETFGVPLQQFGSSTVLEGRINSPGSVAIDAAGTTAPLAAGLVIDDAIFETPGSARARAGDTYNYAPANFLQIPQERYLFGGYADYEFSDGHTAYAELTFVNNRVATELAPTPVTGTFNVDIATVSPFLDAATIAELQQLDANETAANAARIANGLAAIPGAEVGVVSTFLQRRVLEVGARNSLDERNAFRVLGGVKGPIGEYLNYDAYYSFARTRNSNIQSGNVSRSAFQAGLDGTGTPINIFGAGTLTPEAVGAIAIQAQNSDISSQEVFSLAVSGTFGDFSIGSAAPIGFAVGAEHRRLASQFIPDTALSSGDVIGFNAGNATEGSYDVTEIFGELNVPIIDTDGGIRLELDGAARYSDYSLPLVGSTFTYAGGVTFSPIPDVILRGQYQRAIRAPNVGELFGGTAIGFPGATDPCSEAGALTDAALNALCVANGVPAGSVGTTAIQLNAQIPALFGGNPNLAEETSDTFTVGIVLQPSFVPGLTITADYFDITIDDAIQTVGLATQFDLCFNQVQDLTAAACLPFQGVRDLSGVITTANPPLLGGQNIANLSTTGVDFEVNYRTTVPFSLFTDTGEQSLNFNLLGTYLDSFRNVPTPTSDAIECAGRFGDQCGAPRPDFSWVSRLSLIDGPVTTSIRWRHLEGVSDNDDTVDFTAFNGIEEIGSYDLFDLTFAFNVNENVTFSFGVNNLFDKLPGTPEFDANGEVSNRPNSLLLGDNQEQANTFPSTYDTLGRRYFGSVAFKF